MCRQIAFSGVHRHGTCGISSRQTETTARYPLSSPQVGGFSVDLLVERQERVANLTRNSVRSMRAVGRLPNASRRSLPDFVVVGAQRSGTTSLYRRLLEHPQVLRPIGKELQFLTLHFNRGLRWYRAHFPATGRGQQTFEASPYYLFHPLAAPRAAQVLPNARFVALLRDPVDRAYSHYLHSRSLGFETLSFEDAIAAEQDRLSEAAHWGLDTSSGLRLHRNFSYLGRGMYLHQLQRWLSAVPSGSVKAIKSEDFFQQPQQVYADLLEFLRLPAFLPEQFNKSKSSSGVADPMSQATRSRLRDRFAEDSEQVRQLLGWESAWA